MSLAGSDIVSRLKYFCWATLRAGSADLRCPGCGEVSTRLVRRKMLVTALRECVRCHLRFRTPKDDPESREKIYIEETYSQGFTTEMPSDESLQGLLETKFRGTEKDFASRIEILKATGIPAGARILDYGASWGYGSWQMAQEGFEVFSYEIGRERSRYSKEKLGCKVVEDLRSLNGTMDCLFASHVIEHLPDPAILFDAAEKALRPSGVFVCYCPNGDPLREYKQGIPAYDRNWGGIHPLMVTPAFMKREAARRGFAFSNVFTTPIHADAVRSRVDGPLTGEELLTVAYRSTG
jgi:SAM-dependent methyltransferase